MMQLCVCVCCVVRSAPPSQFVMSVKSTTILNVLTPTLVGAMLFVRYNTVQRGLLGGLIHERVNLGLKLG